MARKRKQLPLLENVVIADVAAEGKAIAKVDGMAVFVPYAVPGDVVDIQLTRKKNSFAEGKVVFFAGGTGHPYFSTDTATVLRAIEIEADVILLAKAIDGVYDSDPKVNSEAKRYDTLTIQEVIEQQLAVVDLTASIMCMENKMPMYVFALQEENSIVKAITGEFNGTKVTV